MIFIYAVSHLGEPQVAQFGVLAEQMNTINVVYRAGRNRVSALCISINLAGLHWANHSVYPTP